MVQTNEDILDGIPLGPWNIQFIVLMGMIFISGPVQYYNSVFTNTFVNFTCSTDNEEFNGLNACTTNDSQSCTHYDFDLSEERTTFTTEFNLVCDKTWISDLFQLIFTIGCLFGTAFTGLGDKYGRRAVIRVSSVIHVISILVIGLAPDPFIILGGRFFIGFTYPLMNSAAYTLLTETTPPNRRSIVCFLVTSPSYLSVMLIGVVAYFLIEWKVAYLVLSALPLFLPLNAFLLDESPRWLQQQWRFAEAKTILDKAARLNSGTMKATLSTKLDQDPSTNNEAYTFKNIIKCIKTFFNNFFGTSSMIKISIVMPLLWFIMATAYFGVPLTGNTFTDNTYIYMIVVGAAELPVSLLGPLLVNKLSNINTGTGLFVILGLSMLGIMNFRNSNLWWIKWVLIALSMNCIGLLNCLCSLMTCELFPTTMRTTALAFCKISYYLGFFTASYIESISMSTFWWLYYAVCCICCAGGILIIRLLPETHGSILCNTKEDVVQRDSSHGSHCCNKIEDVAQTDKT